MNKKTNQALSHKIKIQKEETLHKNLAFFFFASKILGGHLGVSSFKDYFEWVQTKSNKIFSNCSHTIVNLSHEAPFLEQYHLKKLLICVDNWYNLHMFLKTKKSKVWCDDNRLRQKFVQNIHGSFVAHETTSICRKCSS